MDHLLERMTSDDHGPLSTKEDLRTYAEQLFTNGSYNGSKKVKDELLLSMEPRGAAQIIKCI